MNNYSTFKVIAESSFYTNNVEKVMTISDAYNKCLNNPGSIITDQEIYKAEELGFPSKAKVIVFNDGDVVGRSSAARNIYGDKSVSKEKFSSILREAVFNISKKEKMYHSQAYIGLDKDFIVKANLLVPKFYENNLLSWLANFQVTNDFYNNMYSKNKIKEEIFVVSDPEWKSEEFPYGLTFFSPEDNIAFILGMRYFGEFKKGTLTLAWAIADRQNFTSCHGGVKSFDKLNYVCAFFGLSGSGKSTLTHSKHNNKYDITILHDDAFIINNSNYQTIALEPSYFDKTSDYKINSEENKYIMTAQNIGVCLDKNNKKILITEDIRNENGRAVKSKLWSPNRVDKLDKKINSIFWLMKDPSLPPLIKINNPILASTFGACLATKRTSAERLASGIDPNALVFEPYANPFRTYPLINDYEKFKFLFENKVNAFILNTGFYKDIKITATLTLSIIEELLENKNIEYKQINEDLEYYFKDLATNFDTALFKEQIKKRIDYLNNLNERNYLPEEAKLSLIKLLN